MYNENMGKKKKPLWERQAWDTQASFNHFHRYYLSQEPPRSVGKAFRNMRADKGIKEDKQKGAPGSWRNWSQAKNRKDKKIKNAIGWSERAMAYDDFLASQDVDEWVERRNEIRQQDYKMGENLRELASAILEHGPDFIIEREKFVKGNKGKPDQLIITIALDVNAAVKTADLASKLQRLAAEMETERTKGEHEHVILTGDEWRDSIKERRDKFKDTRVKPKR